MPSSLSSTAVSPSSVNAPDAPKRLSCVNIVQINFRSLPSLKTLCLSSFAFSAGKALFIWAITTVVDGEREIGGVRERLQLRVEFTVNDHAHACQGVDW